MKRMRSYLAWFLGVLLIITVLQPTSAGAAGPVEQSVVLTSPHGVPAMAQVQGATHQVVAKSGGESDKTQTIQVQPGQYKVEAGPITWRGKRYVSAQDQKQVSLPTKDPVKIDYKLAPGVQDFLPQALDSKSAAFSWVPDEHGGKLDLRRVNGDAVPTDVTAGTGITLGDGKVTDTGLTPGTVYTYALFEDGEPRFHWTLRTADSDAKDVHTTAYVLDPASVTFGAVPKYQAVDDKTARLTWPNGMALPLVDAGVVLPIAPDLPEGFVGKVTALGLDGKTVDIQAASMSDVLAYLDLKAPDLAAAAKNAPEPPALSPSSTPSSRPTPATTPRGSVPRTTAPAQAPESSASRTTTPSPTPSPLAPGSTISSAPGSPSPLAPGPTTSSAPGSPSPLTPAPTTSPTPASPSPGESHVKPSVLPATGADGVLAGADTPPIQKGSSATGQDGPCGVDTPVPQFDFKPKAGLAPDTKFNIHLVMTGFPARPRGITIDTFVGIDGSLGFSLSGKVEADFTCEWELDKLHMMIPIMVEPVPIVIDILPSVKANGAASLEFSGFVGGKFTIGVGANGSIDRDGIDIHPVKVAQISALEPPAATFKANLEVAIAVKVTVGVGGSLGPIGGVAGLAGELAPTLAVDALADLAKNECTATLSGRLDAAASLDARAWIFDEDLVNSSVPIIEGTLLEKQLAKWSTACSQGPGGTSSPGTSPSDTPSPSTSPSPLPLPKSLANAKLQLPPVCQSFVSQDREDLKDPKAKYQFADGKLSPLPGTLDHADVTILGGQVMAAGASDATVVWFSCFGGGNYAYASFAAYDEAMNLVDSWEPWDQASGLQGEFSTFYAENTHVSDGVIAFSEPVGLVGDKTCRACLRSGTADVQLSWNGKNLVEDINYRVGGRAFGAPRDFSGLQKAFDAISAGDDIAATATGAVGLGVLANIDSPDPGGSGSRRKVYFPPNGKIQGCGLADSLGIDMYDVNERLVLGPNNHEIVIPGIKDPAVVTPGEFVCAVTSPSAPLAVFDNWNYPRLYLRVITDAKGVPTITGYGKVDTAGA